MPQIVGKVSKGGKPLGGAYVRLVGPSGEFVAEEYTKEDGDFVFHVGDGTWTVEARAAHAATEVKPVSVTGGDATVWLDLQDGEPTART